MIKTNTLLVLFAILLAPACKKKKTSTPDPDPVINCNIAVEYRMGADTFKYEYDDQDRIIRELQNGVQIATMQYQDNGSTVIQTTPTVIYTYTLNSDGFPVKIVESSNDGSVTKRYYTYDANNLMTEYRTELIDAQSNVSKDSSKAVFTMANNNLITMVFKEWSGTVKTTVQTTHDLTRPNNVPNVKPYVPVGLLNTPWDNNLMTHRDITSGSTHVVWDILYEYDAKGRVLKRIINSTGSQPASDTMSYVYRCE